jgi:DNA-binding response OmpR family regulator
METPLKFCSDQNGRGSHFDDDVPVSNNQETILVVDDDPAALDDCCSALAHGGYHVFLAASAERALEIWSGNSQAIDLALVAVSMPGISGLELVKRLRDQEPRARIALISSCSSEEVEGLIGEAGANFSIFWKPFDVSSFLLMIRTMLDRPAPAEKHRRHPSKGRRPQRPRVAGLTK